MKKIRKAESLAAGCACKTKGSSGSLTEVSTDKSLWRPSGHSTEACKTKGSSGSPTEVSTDGAFGGPQITAEKDFSFKSSPAILYTTSK